MKSIYILEPLSDKCIDWVESNVLVGDFQPYRGEVVIEHRFVEDIWEALQFNGFRPNVDFALF
jgi:hypothetical protein